MTSRRWPLHPAPYNNESISSWIRRIAKAYDIRPKDLLMSEFDIDIKSNELNALDIKPPINLLQGLSERTGFEMNVIHALTGYVYTPLLIDVFDLREADLSAFAIPLA